MKKMYLSPLFVALFGLTACGGNDIPGSTTAVEHATWSYEGSTAPAHWGDLKAADGTSYATCGTGTTQSPINLTAADPQDLPNIAFDYNSNSKAIINNGHTVEVVAEGTTSNITVDGEVYDLEQVHFHSPSEHQVNGQNLDAEFHFVHKAENGTLAVVAVLLKAGSNTENTVYANLLEQFKLTEGNENIEVNLTSAINFANLLPTTRGSYRYTGSLTTPPCTEGVKWHVMTTPIEITDAQLTELQTYFKDNNRPVNQIVQHVLIQDTTPAQ